MTDLRSDIRYAFRGLRKSPVFSLFAAATLALGIGANTTVFTVINTLILNPLPVRDAGSLTAIAAVDARSFAKSGVTFPLSYPDLEDYRAGNKVFGSLAGYTSPRVLSWKDKGATERLFGELVTDNYFSTLGLAPAKGRFFAPEENGTPGAHPVAVMNYATWQTRFGADDGIVGRTVQLNGLAFTVVGVAPRQFIGVNAIFGPDVWIPAAMAERLLPNEQGILIDRGRAAFLGVGRLQQGTERAQAQASMTVLASSLSRAYPATNEGPTVAVRPLRDALLGSAMGDSR